MVSGHKVNKEKYNCQKSKHYEIFQLNLSNDSVDENLENYFNYHKNTVQKFAI